MHQQFVLTTVLWIHLLVGDYLNFLNSLCWGHPWGLFPWRNRLQEKAYLKVHFQNLDLCTTMSQGLSCLNSNLNPNTFNIVWFQIFSLVEIYLFRNVHCHPPPLLFLLGREMKLNPLIWKSIFGVVRECVCVSDSVNMSICFDNKNSIFAILLYNPNLCQFLIYSTVEDVICI